MTTTMTKTPVTLFFSSDFGFGPNKVEGWLLEHGRRPYAQYPAAPFVKLVPKGKRNPRGWVEGFRPYLVILAGHGLELNPTPFETCESTTPGVTVKRSRYTSCDPRNDTDFDKVLDKWLEANPEKLVADYRWTKDTTTEEG